MADGHFVTVYATDTARWIRQAPRSCHLLFEVLVRPWPAADSRAFMEHTVAATTTTILVSRSHNMELVTEQVWARRPDWCPAGPR